MIAVTLVRFTQITHSPWRDPNILILRQNGTKKVRLGNRDWEYSRDFRLASFDCDPRALVVFSLSLSLSLSLRSPAFFFFFILS